MGYSKKPLIFIILGTLLILEPIFKILYFKANTEFPFEAIIRNLSAMEGFKNIFDFWILFPLGGLALLNINRLTYFIFFGVQIYSIYSSLTYEPYTWPYVNATPHFFSMTMLFFNVMIMLYFLLPSVRTPFFNKRSRWWETATRYTIHHPCTVNIIDVCELAGCEILNISKTGALIYGPKEIFDENYIDLLFSPLEGKFKFSLRAEVVGKHEVNNRDAYRLHFHFASIWENISLRRYIMAVHKNHDVPRR
ncbi:MAG: hypothetical protein A2504_09085 [Bdellovibrionales bacterium RIFOXYD12_FULL_39_22]|nr:MAG: hypothetical protein A2385_17465 [Bdellovibrionales bacterium RIFOXYB1_FULL_39_21]OFZ41105.1 MAG: hypothetical protein A2485_00390 [Bdellovibrionales bacterium RIFOXYC12_FULL_39_17]OFZ50318.1 MAG: hypothetical protein A2404_07705 [Bdellovibrionales bacterium RIFOXYC1_FULL_39_130]OFZ72046.1 MAG: hypothetical protein A2451_07130 [Bdellovibrionales bacterium RIFOXYC2_FULL_39_8]OFZ75119.1 MAG: hypothetical protein A2560_16400 [Bdellovibrionales bacterium RIFOXYD1_FULL_39_84]OFZ92239.1 MAG: